MQDKACSETGEHEEKYEVKNEVKHIPSEIRVMKDE